MSTLGIDLNDAGIAVADAHRLLGVSPGYAWRDGDQLHFGELAWREAARHPRRIQNRFWRELNEAPLSAAGFDAVTAADLVHDHLAELREQHLAGCDALVAAVPAHWTNEQLGRFLGIADELGLTVLALVDAAVAAARRCYEGANLIHVEASLFDATLTRLEQNGHAAVGVRQTSGGLGITALERAGVEYFANLFVAQTRFDPLHDAATEQALFVNAYDWLQRLAREGDIEVQIESGSHAFSARASYTDYRARLDKTIEPALQQLRGMLSSDKPSAVQLNGLLMRFPGVADAIGRLPRVQVFGLETGAAAIGAASRAGAFQASAGHRLHKRLPWDLPALRFDADAAAADALAVPARATGDRPTHAVLGGRAYRLDSRPFQIGTHLADNEYGVQIDAIHGGVSRRHCAIVITEGGVELIDHSRHGTALNGHTIERAAILQPGDRISFGTPPVDILLIAEVGDDGA